jgi:hypothetical protein
MNQDNMNATSPYCIKTPSQIEKFQRVQVWLKSVNKDPQSQDHDDMLTEMYMELEAQDLVENKPTTFSRCKFFLLYNFPNKEVA